MEKLGIQDGPVMKTEEEIDDLCKRLEKLSLEGKRLRKRV